MRRYFIVIFSTFSLSLFSQTSKDWWLTYKAQKSTFFYKAVVKSISFPEDIIFNNKKVGTLLEPHCKDLNYARTTSFLCLGRLEFENGFKVSPYMKFFKVDNPIGDNIVRIEMDETAFPTTDTIEIRESPQNNFMCSGTVKAIKDIEGGYIAFIKNPFQHQLIKAIVKKSNMPISKHYKKFKVGQAAYIWGDKIMQGTRLIIVVREFSFTTIP